MKKQLKKILEKAIIFSIRSITFLAVILLFVFSCAVELEGVGAIICTCCVAWLGLVGLIVWLDYKNII